MAKEMKNIEDFQKELAELDPRYQVEKIIGSGSYGVVLRARDRSDNNILCAIKRVNKEIFEEVILAKRILREIKLLEAKFSFKLERRASGFQQGLVSAGADTDTIHGST